MTPVKITEEAPLRIRRANRRTDRGTHRPGRKRKEHAERDRNHASREEHSEKRRHFAPRTRTSKDAGKAARKERTQTKEPNRSVFKPYFKD